MSNKIDPEGHQHIDTNRARGGTTVGMMRYVLGISLTLVVIAFALVYFLV